VKSSEPKFTLTFGKLRSEYRSNPRAAEAKYGGELVRIRGVIKRFTGFFDDSLEFDDGGGGTTAELVDSNQLLRVKVGIRVVLLCNVAGMGSMDFIRLDGCILEEPTAQSEGDVAAVDSNGWVLKAWRCDMGNGIKYRFDLKPTGSSVSYGVNMMDRQSDQGKMKIAKLAYGSTKVQIVGEYGDAKIEELPFVDVWTDADTDMLSRFRLLRRSSSRVMMYGELDGEIGGKPIADCF